MRRQRKGGGFSRSFAKKGALVANRRADPFRAERLRVKAAARLLTLRGESSGKTIAPRNKAGHRPSDECPALFILHS